MILPKVLKKQSKVQLLICTVYDDLTDFEDSPKIQISICLDNEIFFFSSTIKIHSLYIRAIIWQKAVSWRRNIKSHSPRAAVAPGNGHMFTEDSVHYENNV